MNETISCKKGYMLSLRNVLNSNQSQIIVGEKVSNNLYEDLQIISNRNVSLSFDSNPSRILFRFCVKLQINRY